ncbi:MAG: hypothetical protein GYA14_16175 [Ignavibacteria bacterium]|nr:hypothetical protein [Ignavibacteria bacterium]
MKYNSYQNRKSPRLKSWDYSKPHWYFVTIYTHNHINHFGEIKNEKPVLNKLGLHTEDCVKNISSHYKNVEIDYHIVMPNHIHVIIIINPDALGTCHGMSLQNDNVREFGKPTKGSLSMIINHFKGAVTKWANLNGHKNFKWQRSFYDRIIRNEKELYQIRKYIEQNPLAWDLEKNISENLEL